MAKGIEGLPEIIYPEFIQCKNWKIANTDKLLSGCAPNNRLGLIYLSEHKGVQKVVSDLVLSGKILVNLRYVKECLFISDGINIPNNIFYSDYYLPDHGVVIEFDERKNHNIHRSFDEARDNYLMSIGIKVIRLSIELIYSNRINDFISYVSAKTSNLQINRLVIDYTSTHKNKNCLSWSDYRFNTSLSKFVSWIYSIPKIVKDIRIKTITKLRFYIINRTLFDVYNIDFRYGDEYNLNMSKFELGAYLNLLPDRHGRKAYSVVWRLKLYFGITINLVKETNWDFIKWRSENYEKYLDLNKHFNGLIYDNVNKPMLSLTIPRTTFCKLTKVPVGNGINYIPFMVGYLRKYYNVDINVKSRYVK